MARKELLYTLEDCASVTEPPVFSQALNVPFWLPPKGQKSFCLRGNLSDRRQFEVQAHV
jgi:hypothetical protein